jgi:hypothetical protein
MKKTLRFYLYIIKAGIDILFHWPAVPVRPSDRKKVRVLVFFLFYVVSSFYRNKILAHQARRPSSASVEPRRLSETTSRVCCFSRPCPSSTDILQSRVFSRQQGREAAAAGRLVVRPHGCPSTGERRRWRIIGLLPLSLICWFPLQVVALRLLSTEGEQRQHMHIKCLSKLQTQEN